MLYHGIDMIEVARLRQAVERWGERFLCRVFTPGELADCGITTGVPRFESLAARWAAKEAAAKAFGLGLSGLAAGAGPHLGWHEIEVVRGPAGRPLLRLHGAASAATAGAELALSLSHTRDYALASVVGVARP
jgi:holo-[acyl-carrier protein] synthase